MRPEARGALLLFVLMVIIWGFVIGMARSTVWYIVLAAAIWATVDFARAFWAWYQAATSPDEEEDEAP